MKYASLLIVMVAMTFLTCKEDKAKPNANIESCYTGKVVKTAKNLRGVVSYNTQEKQYAVYVTIPGTIDSRDVGFICDKLDSLKKEELVIEFSGNYYDYKENAKPPMGGLTYYYLDITDYKISK